MRPVLLAALTAAVFAVHAVPAGDGGAVLGSAPLLTEAGPAPGHRLVFRLPGGWRPAAVLPGAWELTTGDALRRCRTEAQVTGLASDRGVREEDGVLFFRTDVRRPLRIASARRGPERSWWRESLVPGGLGGRPVDAVVRFPTPPSAGLGPAAPTTTVRIAVLSHADVAPQARVTDALLARCKAQTRRVAPPALDAITATASVTTAPRATP